MIGINFGYKKGLYVIIRYFIRAFFVITGSVFLDYTPRFLRYIHGGKVIKYVNPVIAMAKWRE